MAAKIIEIHEASLDDLLALMRSGIEVVLMDGEQPLARMLPI